MVRRGPGKLLLLSLGWIALGAGTVGVALPGIPTTPFLLLAAWLFSLGSPRLERWLNEHPRFGPMIRDWRRRRALTLRAKLLATIFKAAAVLLFYLQSGNLWGTIVLGTLLTGVAIYLWSRPTASRVSRAA